MVAMKSVLKQIVLLVTILEAFQRIGLFLKHDHAKYVYFYS